MRWPPTSTGKLASSLTPVSAGGLTGSAVFAASSKVGLALVAAIVATALTKISESLFKRLATILHERGNSRTKIIDAKASARIADRHAKIDSHLYRSATRKAKTSAEIERLIALHQAGQHVQESKALEALTGRDDADGTNVVALRPDELITSNCRFDAQWASAGVRSRRSAAANIYLRMRRVAPTPATALRTTGSLRTGPLSPRLVDAGPRRTATALAGTASSLHAAAGTAQ